jgi:ATP-binding cassette subfamily B protein
MFLNGYCKGKLAEGIAYDMRTKLHSHILDLSVSYHNNADTGDLIQRCTSDIDTIKGFLSAQLPEIVYIFSSVSFGAIQMGLANWQIMLVTFAVVPITVTASVIYFRYVKKKFEEIEKVEANMTTVLEENVNGVRVVKAFANENYEIRKFEKASSEYRDQSKKLNDVMAVYWGSSDFITMIQYAVTVLTAILLVKSNSNVLSSGDFVSFTMYIGMIVWPIRGLGRIIGDFGKSVVAAGRINDILKEKTEYAVMEFKPRRSAAILNSAMFRLNSKTMTSTSFMMFHFR